MSPNRPSINPDRCVHGQVVNGSCDRCVGTCPTEAIVLDDESLGIVEEDCIGCGLCVRACPTAAIELPLGQVRLAGGQADRVAYAACAHCTGQAGQARVTCVNAIGLADLSAMHNRGVRELRIRDGCDFSVGRSAGPSLDLAIERFARLAASRGLPGIRLQRLAAPIWDAAEQAAGSRQPHARSPSRRALLSALIPSATAAVADRLNLDELTGGSLAGRDRDGALYPHVPDIDPALCSGCDACIQICPTAALTLVNPSPEQTAYRIDQAPCTGCMLCVDVCDQQAVSVTAMMPAGRSEIPLYSARCRACGVQFHHPPSRESESVLCRICRATNRAAQLFQVLE